MYRTLEIDINQEIFKAG